MTLISMVEIHEGRSGGDKIADKQRSSLDFTRRWRATTSSVYDGPDVALAGLPALGTPHPANKFAFAHSRKVDNHNKSKFVYLCTVNYSTDPIVGTNPANDPAEISWDTELYTRPYDRDYKGKPVINKVGDPFVPPPNDTDAYWVATIKKNVTRVPGWLLQYRNAINSDAVNIDGIQVPKLCAWLKSIKLSNIQYRSPYRYRALTMVIACKSGIQIAANNGGQPPILDDWKVYIANKGTRVLQNWNPALPTYGQPINALNFDGTTSRIQVWLDANGGQLANPTPANIIFLPFQLKNSQPFNSLPLR